MCEREGGRRGKDRALLCISVHKLRMCLLYNQLLSTQKVPGGEVSSLPYLRLCLSPSVGQQMQRGRQAGRYVSENERLGGGPISPQLVVVCMKLMSTSWRPTMSGLRVHQCVHVRVCFFFFPGLEVGLNWMEGTGEA